MAKDKVELEIDPVISPGAEEKIKGVFSRAFSGGMSAAKIAGGAALAGPGVMAAAATAPIGVAKGLDALLGGFVNAFNPAAMQQFELAISDTVAVIGEMLVPVINNLVPLIRTWGDFLASILPSQKEIDQVMKAFAPLMETVKDFLVAIAPAIKEGLVLGLDLFANAVKTVVPMMIGMAKSLAEAWARVIYWINNEFAQLGMNVGNRKLADSLWKFAHSKPGEMGGFSGSSVGRSAGGASSMAFGGLSEKLVMASLGLGAEKSPETTELEKLNERQENLRKEGAFWMQMLIDHIKERQGFPGGGNN